MLCAQEEELALAKEDVEVEGHHHEQQVEMQEEEHPGDEVRWMTDCLTNSWSRCLWSKRADEIETFIDRK